MVGYLSVKAMAERTGLSEERIRQLIRTHQIRRAVKLGGWLVRVEDFEQFLKSRTYGPDGSDRTEKSPPPPSLGGNSDL
jgi:excisionase family DNA binding protein